MKFGVKTFHNKKFLDYFIGKADFFEVQAIQTNNYDFLKKYVKLKIPFVIHAEHFRWGFNPADKTKKESNLKSVNFAQELADKTKAEKIIIHPGLINNNNCSKEHAIDFFKKINDKRVLIENLAPAEDRLCSLPNELEDFIKQTNKRFIYDLSHTILASIHFNLDKIKLIKDFLKLKPDHFHISGQNFNSTVDQHGTFKIEKDNMPNFKDILKLYPKDAEITLEVTPDIKKTEYDLKFIRDFVKDL